MPPVTAKPSKADTALAHRLLWHSSAGSEASASDQQAVLAAVIRDRRGGYHEVRGSGWLSTAEAAGEGSELMRSFQSTWRCVALSTWVAIATALLIATAHAQGSRLGLVQFPTSAQSQEAQAHFVRGVAALHSFWYPVALEEFRAATQIGRTSPWATGARQWPTTTRSRGDPQDTEAAREVLARLPAAPAAHPTGAGLPGRGEGAIR